MAVLNLTIARSSQSGRVGVQTPSRSADGPSRAADGPSRPADRLCRSADAAWRLADAPAEAGDIAEHGAKRALAHALHGASSAAPVLFMIHGYRYDPNDAAGDPRRDPHRVVLRPAHRRTRAAQPLSWPEALGFDEPPERRGAEQGLAIGVGWSSLPPAGRRGSGAGRALSWAYGAAAQTAESVASILRFAAATRSDLRFDLFAHSLGARVAFLALRIAASEGWSGRIGRILALGAAEYQDMALRAARCCRPGGPEVINFTSRANDPYDALLQLLGPRAALARNARPLGAGGLGRRAPGWIDIQLDHPAMQGWLARQGVAVAGAGRFCRHDAFYARSGIAALHRRLLDRRWTGEDLRAAGVVEAIEPRWARFAPIRRRDLPTPRALTALGASGALAQAQG